LILVKSTFVIVQLNKCGPIYEAFRKITNFIRNNGDDWNEFCTNTTRTARKPTIPTHSLNSISKHKTDKNKGHLAPEPLL
jgi:hypothetical protein